MKKIITNSAESTKEFAKKLAQKYKNGAIIALNGPLGAGKTTFAQGFAHGLGIQNKILSPTFVLMREYIMPSKPDAKLFHIDLYRLEGSLQIESLGLSDLFANSKNIILIEWAEKLTKIPTKMITINFENLSENSRQITLKD